LTDLVKVAIISSSPGIITAVLSIFNRMKLGQVSTQMDGRMSELLDSVRKASKAEGVKEEKERQ
jgi:hypothetical protein